MSDYYAPSGTPTYSSPGSSSAMQAEFSLISAGFDKLPTLTGAGTRVPYINAGGTAQITSSAFTFDGTTLTVPTLTATTISGAALSGTFSGTPTFSGAVTMSSTLTLGGLLANNTSGGLNSLVATGYEINANVTNGLQMHGYGTTNDVSIEDYAGNQALVVPHGTQNVQVVGILYVGTAITNSLIYSMYSGEIIAGDYSGGFYFATGAGINPAKPVYIGNVGTTSMNFGVATGAEYYFKVNGSTVTTISATGAITTGIAGAQSVFEGSVSTYVLSIRGTGTGDGLRIQPLAAGSGVQVAAVDHTLSVSYEPLQIYGSFVQIGHEGNADLLVNTDGRIIINSGGTTAAEALRCYGTSNQWSGYFQSLGSGGLSYGLLIDAGSTSADSPLYVRNYNGTIDLLQLLGDGTLVLPVGTITTQSSNPIVLATSGGTGLQVPYGASLVNYWQAYGSATGAVAQIGVGGSDTNINCQLFSQGTGYISLATNRGAQEQARITHTASADCYLTITGGVAASGINASISASAAGISLSVTNVNIGATTYQSTVGLMLSQSAITAGGGTAYGILNRAVVTAAANSDNLIGYADNLHAVESGTYTGLLYAQMYLDGSGVTKSGTGTIASAMCLYLTAPTIGTSNYSLYINSGTALLQAATFNGAITAAAGLTVSSGHTLTLTGATVAGAPTWSSSQAITLSTAAQPNVTSLGTLTSLTVSGTLTPQALVDISGASAGQIKFPATQNASANANTLDDYEEGTWTPSLGGTATYSLQAGKYTKIGNAVTITGILGVSTIGTGNTMGMSGLPFTNNSSTIGSYSYRALIGSATAIVSASLGTAVSGTDISFFSRTAASASDSANAIFQNGTQVGWAGVYHT